MEGHTASDAASRPPVRTNSVVMTGLAVMGWAIECFIGFRYIHDSLSVLLRKFSGKLRSKETFQVVESATIFSRAFV